LNELYYVYPMSMEVSFKFIGRHHIAHLKNRVKVQEIDHDVLDNIMWVPGKRVLLHPILYTTIGDRVQMFPRRIKRLEKLTKVSDLLGGFETCDTDEISEISVKVLDHFEPIFVPSNFARSVFIKCGVENPVEVLPHGLPDPFLEDSSKITSPNIKPLLDLKQRHGAVLILYHLFHSGYRKGADLVYKAMERIQHEYHNAFLVVKRLSNLDPYLGLLRKLKMVEVAGFLQDWEYVQLYDLCDILLIPSRGGGFEHNALEGIARGLPTVATGEGCFKDYIEYVIPVKVARKVEVLPGNPIHVGKGFEVDVEDLHHKLSHTIDNLPKIKRRFEQNARIIKRKYSWSRICEKLWDRLIRYGFVEK